MFACVARIQSTHARGVFEHWLGLQAETADATPSEKPGKTKEELEELSPNLHDPG